MFIHVFFLKIQLSKVGYKETQIQSRIYVDIKLTFEI